MRQGIIERNTAETNIRVQLTLDGGSQRSVDTGIGFFDHMLEQLGKHGFMDLQLTCKGDIHVDGHHTVEDCGIALGQAFCQALGDKKGIHRYGSMLLPMDEALCQAAVDISGRPMLVWNVSLPITMIGGFDAQLTEEFFRAFVMSAGITLHVTLLDGKNAHHIVECVFKCVARALAEAVAMDPRMQGLPSTKGVL